MAINQSNKAPPLPNPVSLFLVIHLFPSSSTPAHLLSPPLLRHRRPHSFFYEARKAWYLADIFFFRRKDGPVLGHLLEWSRECNGGRESGDDGFREPEADRFWETAYKFLLKGMFDEFEDWLDLEVRARTEASSYAFLLEMLTGWRALNKGERGAAELDLVKWKKWRGECGRVNDDDARFQHDDGEKLIVCCRILAGDEGVLAKYGSELLEGWYELAVTKVLYTEPGARVPQLYKSITWAQQVYNYDPIDGSEYRLENMCNSIMNQDHFTFFKGACEGFAADDDWWFCCHFADLMDVRDPLDAARSAYGGGGDVQRSGFREYIVLDFATHMFQHPSLWSAAAEYFGSCPVEGEAALQAHLERVPLDSERKARKLIRLCQESSQYTTLDGVPFELHHVADDICKVMGKKAFAQSRTSSALGWYLQAKDGGRVAQIADHFLRLHKTNCDTAILDRQQEPPQFDPSDVVDTFSGIHPDSLVSDRLTFLVEYKKFHRIMATPGEGEARIANYKRAAAILVSTLVGMTYSSTAMAPCWFWLHLLLDACHWRRGWTTSQQRCPLLEHDTIIFDVEQTHVLLRSLAQLELSHNGYLEDEQDTDVMEEIYGALRLTLARNLSRAILVQP